MLILRYAARSDVGIVRAENEDSGYAGSRMLVVADGMGGHAAGELASATTVATFAELDVDEDLRPGDDEVLGMLATAVDEAHDALNNVAEAAPESRGMGTTVTAMAWLNDRVAIAHIGDSRAYLVRDGNLIQLTKDHTYVQTLVDSGQITSEQAATHERRNLLTKALDGVHDVESDLSIREVRAGDRFLLCSDGLHGVVPVERLTELLTSDVDPTGTVDALVEDALSRGAPDNVTALVADVVEVPEADADVQRSAIVVGAAAEHRNRDRLPGMYFPADSQPDAAPTPAAAPSQESEPTPQARAKRRLRLPLILGITGAALVIVGLLAGWAWTRSQYYVGDSGGSVAIFQGVPLGVGGNGLSTVEQVSNTKLAELPEFERSQVASNIPAASADDALRIVATLAATAQSCKQLPTPAGCPTPASPAGATTPPGATPSASVPSVSATPTQGAGP